jgi:hypothetical protein
MTMMRMTLAAGLLALAACIPAAQAADDDLRLKLPATPDDDASVRTLGANNDDLDAETLEMRYYGGYRGGYGGYRGGYGGYRGFVGYRGGYGYGGYRGFYGYRGGYYGGYRGFYGGYRGLYAGYGGYGYGGYGYGGYGGYYPSYYSSYYSYPIYSYPVYSYYYSPCATVIASAPTTTLDYRVVPSTPTPADPTLTEPTTPSLKTTPAPPMPRVDGTYPYNGGPGTPVPMPRGGDEAMTLPRVPTPILDRVVSLKDEPMTGKYVYPAYGELPRRSGR